MHLIVLISAVALALQFPGAALLSIPATTSIALCMGLTAGHVMANSIPATFLSAPDESNAFTAASMRHLQRTGRGVDAVLWTAAGTLMGAAILLIIASPVGLRAIPALIHIIHPHTHWIVVGMIAFVLVSGIDQSATEWPQGLRFQRVIRSCISPVLFLMAGCIGLAILRSAPLQPLGLARRFVPAIVGLYAAPGFIMWLTCHGADRHREFRTPGAPPLTRRPDLYAAVAAGMWSGALALSVPGMSSATGGFLCTRLLGRDAAARCVAKGAMAVVFYAGAALLLLVPGTPFSLNNQGVPLFFFAGAPQYYYVGIAAYALATGAAFLYLPVLARIAVHVVTGTRPALIAWALSSACVVIAFLCGGPSGLAVLAASTGIGILAMSAPQAHLPGLGLFLLPLVMEPLELNLLFNALPGMR